MQNRKRDHTNYEITSFVTPTFARHSWQLKTANPRLVKAAVSLGLSSNVNKESIN